jgi:hypothetical protein
LRRIIVDILFSPTADEAMAESERRVVGSRAGDGNGVLEKSGRDDPTLQRRESMTLTTYYVTHRPERSAEAGAIVHLINDRASETGDNRSWDAIRAQVDALADAETQQRLGIAIEAEHNEVHADD